MANLDLYSLGLLEEELQPIYEFTVNCEGDCITQAQVFVEFRALEAKLEVINTDRSKRLLELAQIRFDTTADLNISKLCYYLTNAGFHEKIQRFPHVSEEDATKSLENATLLIKETEFIDSLKPTIIEICRILKIQQDLVLVAFEYMMKFFTPKNSEIKEHPTLLEIHKCFDPILNNLHCTTFHNFIEVLSILPASEASSERVFARMRDMLNIKQTRLSAKALRSKK